jgi:hypothetical protein
MLFSADKSTDVALKEATEQSMYAGVNKGCLRVDENIVLDEEKVRQEFVSKYEKMVNYKAGTSNLYIHQLNGYAPLLAAEAYQTISTPFERYLNGLDGGGRSDENSVRAFQVGIFEATSLEKPITAEGIGDLSMPEEVDNFQCK